MKKTSKPVAILFFLRLNPSPLFKQSGMHWINGQSLTIQSTQISIAFVHTKLNILNTYSIKLSKKKKKEFNNKIIMNENLNYSIFFFL